MANILDFITSAQGGAQLSGAGSSLQNLRLAAAAQNRRPSTAEVLSALGSGLSAGETAFERETARTEGLGRQRQLQDLQLAAAQRGETAAKELAVRQSAARTSILGDPADESAGSGVSNVPETGLDLTDTERLRVQLSGDIGKTLAAIASERRTEEKFKVGLGFKSREEARAERKLDLTELALGKDDEKSIRATEKLTIEAAARARTAAVKAKNKTFDQAKALRSEFTKSSVDFVKIRDAFQRINVAAQDPSAAGDLALIFNYMKMLDPGSVVRESEFATAQNSAGVPERVRAMFNKMLEGERMSTNQRADFVTRAQKLFEGQKSLQDATVERFTDLANEFKIAPNVVVSDISQGLLPTTEPGAPKPKGTGKGGVFTIKDLSDIAGNPLDPSLDKEN